MVEVEWFHPRDWHKYVFCSTQFVIGSTAVGKKFGLILLENKVYKFMDYYNQTCRSQNVT